MKVVFIPFVCYDLKLLCPWQKVRSPTRDLPSHFLVTRLCICSFSSSLSRKALPAVPSPLPLGTTFDWKGKDRVRILWRQWFYVWGEEKLQRNPKPVGSSTGVFLCFPTVPFVPNGHNSVSESLWYENHICLAPWHICTIIQQILVAQCCFKINLNSLSLGFYCSFHCLLLLLDLHCQVCNFPFYKQES